MIGTVSGFVGVVFLRLGPKSQSEAPGHVMHGRSYRVIVVSEHESGHGAIDIDRRGKRTLVPDAGRVFWGHAEFRSCRRQRAGNGHQITAGQRGLYEIPGGFRRGLIEQRGSVRFDWNDLYVRREITPIKAFRGFGWNLKVGSVDKVTEDGRLFVGQPSNPHATSRRLNGLKVKGLRIHP